MKKFLPFVFPFIAFLIVIFLAVRWYNSKTHRPDGQIPDFASDVKIEDLSQAQVDQMKNQSAKDEKTVEMTGNSDVKGQIRYDIHDGKVFFSVYANLPQLTQGYYQVWLKQVDGDARRKAFQLQFTKSGYVGSAAIASSTLPFEVLVTQQNKENEPTGAVILTGVLPKEEAKTNSK